MTIYLDVVFLINLLYQLWILKLLDVIFQLHTPFLRLLLGGICGSVGYCMCILMKIRIFLFPANMIAGVLLGLLVLPAAFAPLRVRQSLLLIPAQLFLNCVLGGILSLLPGGTSVQYLVLLAGGALIFAGMFCRKMRELLLARAHQTNCIRQIRLIHRGNKVAANALIDTGNSLKDPISGEPVMIVDTQIAGEILPEGRIEEQPGYRLIPFDSIGVTKGVMEAFRIEVLEVEENIVRKRVICAVYHGRFQSAEQYQVLLHPKLL